MTRDESSTLVRFEKNVVHEDGALVLNAGAERATFGIFGRHFGLTSWCAWTWEAFEPKWPWDEFEALLNLPSVLSLPYVRIEHQGLPFKSDHNLATYVQLLVQWKTERLALGLQTELVFSEDVRVAIEDRLHPSSDLDEAQLRRIEKRCEDATDGPWEALVEGRDFLGGDTFVKMADEDLYLRGATEDDHDFIAHARQDIPALVAEVRRLQAELAKVSK